MLGVYNAGGAPPAPQRAGKRNHGAGALNKASQRKELTMTTRQTVKNLVGECWRECGLRAAISLVTFCKAFGLWQTRQEEQELLAEVLAQG